jgi:hypothetical protein
MWQRQRQRELNEPSNATQYTVHSRHEPLQSHGVKESRQCAAKLLEDRLRNMDSDGLRSKPCRLIGTVVDRQ